MEISDRTIYQNIDVYSEPITFAVKHKSDNERMASQSGGMFAVLSDAVLDRKGIIYGCVFDDNFRAVHWRAENASERDRMRYSKYVQSDMGDIFRQVLDDLRHERWVLFSGTSCQIAGLKSYIEMSPEIPNRGLLYTVDIVCHGVPSPLVWERYLEWESQKHKAEIAEVYCRNKKKYGWQSHVTTILFKNKRTIDSRVFPKIFYGHNILRPSCYRCPYKSIQHPADITIADYWGIDKALPGFRDNKGVSLVLVNNSRGKELFDVCSGRMIFRKTRIEDSLQKPLIEPYDAPSGRPQFWTDFYEKPFGEIAKTYGNNTLIRNLKWKTKYFLKNRILSGIRHK